MNTEKPTTEAGREYMRLYWPEGPAPDYQQSRANVLSAITAIEDEARKPLLDTNARLTGALQMLRVEINAMTDPSGPTVPNDGMRRMWTATIDRALERSQR